ncbi:hypothetical protein GGS20DRAFT_148762 [Poronia punctata]|nr:hypothetical protein GGS20DRAFT_148762 [Poronia punctata]
MADPAIAFHNLSPEQQQAALNDSALPPPNGIIPNFEHPPNESSIAHGVLATVIVVTTTFIFLAAYGKAVHTRRVYFEDGLALISIISWAVFIGYLYTATTQHGYFVHQWDIRLRDIADYLYLFYVAILTYFITMSLIKGAIVLEWARIFVPRGTRNMFWWTCYIVAALNFAASVIMLFLVVFACEPREKFWNFLVIGTCNNALATIYIAPIINLVFDVIILVLPHRVIWGLHLSFQKKLGVSLLFALGILAVISTSFRIATSFKFANSPDQAYNIAGTDLWCLAEMSAGILVYCAPSAPIAVKRLMGKPQTVVSGGYKSSTTASKPISWRDTERQGYKYGDYRELDEIPLTNIPPSSTVVQSNTSVDRHPEEGILRTTDVTTTVADRRDYDRTMQHSWEAGGNTTGIAR